MDRRKFMGYAGSGALAALSFRAMRRGTKAYAATNPPLILSVRIQGGWDPTLVFDNKIGLTSVAHESGALLTTLSDTFSFVSHPNRPSVNDFFTSHMNNTAIINGIDCRGIEHIPAFDQSYSIPLKSGHHRGEDRRADPSLVYAIQLNPGMIAPHVNIGCRSTAGAFASYSHQLDSNSITRYATGTLHQASSFSAGANDLVMKHLNSQYAKTLGTFPSIGIDSEKIDSLASNYSREQYFYSVMPEILQSIGSPSSTLLRNLKVAIRLLADGNTLSAAVGDENFLGWDTHQNHFVSQSALFESLFNDLSSAVHYATELNIDDKLLIIVGSDVGRSPFLNSQLGKDHWSYNSALICGSMIKGNQIIGKTDDTMRGQKINLETGAVDVKDGKLMTMANLYATAFTLAELPVNDHFYGVGPLNLLISGGS